MEFNSKYEVALAILKKLNSDISTTPQNNYEVALAVLEAIKKGGGTSTEPLYLYANNSTSTFNWNGTEIPNVEYSLDGGKTYKLITNTSTISLPEKTKVYLRGQNLSGFTNTNSSFFIKGKVSVGGNLGSVINGIDPTAAVNIYDFSYFFKQNSGDGVTEFFTDFLIPMLQSLKLEGFLYQNKVLVTIPLINTKNCTIFTNMFYGCINLTTIPLINTSNGTLFNSMFRNCTNLTTIPLIDTSNGTLFNSMFRNCTNLTSIPQLDTSKSTRFDAMFSSCGKLTSIPQLDTKNGTNLSNMFYGCSNLATIPTIDTTNGTNFTSMFSGCSKLKNITFTGSINVDLDFSSSPLLTFESVKSILTAASNTTNTNSKTLTFSSSLTIKDPNAELPPLITACVSKGWTFQDFNVEVG